MSQGEKVLTGPGHIWEGSSGKSGSGRRACLSFSSPQGPGADKPMAQGAVGRGLLQALTSFCPGQQEEPHLPLDCLFLRLAVCPVWGSLLVREGMGKVQRSLPSSVISRGRGRCLSLQHHHVDVLLPNTGAGGPDGLTQVSLPKDELFVKYNCQEATLEGLLPSCP